MSEKQEMTDEDFRRLKLEIVAKMNELDELQEKYRQQTGQDYRPFI